MKILVVSKEDKKKAEFEAKITGKHVEVIYAEAETDIDGFDAIFDLDFDRNSDIQKYKEITNSLIFVNAVYVQLAEVMSHVKELKSPLIGMNALPTFINRSLMEFSLFLEKDQQELDVFCKQLAWEYKIVKDRVGMVTPRVVCMIINEACYTVQEGTATKQDIDLGMKLGTNYPMGPFEWGDQIGVTHVYQLLDHIYQDTRDERYKICPLLKDHYLRNSSFL